MTIDQTRQLAVEFERRINTIDPTTESIGKLDTDTIFAYLNSFQDQYIQQLYLAEGQAESGSRPAIRIGDIIKTLTKREVVTKENVYGNTDLTSDYFKLPEDYYMYIRSNSIVTGTYKNLNKNNVVPNTIIKQGDVEDVIRAYYNSKSIMRNPVAVLDNPLGMNQSMLQIIHDGYTKINGVEIIYCKLPNRFDIINNKCCELPYECFNDLVSGAVELYFNDKYKLAIATSAARRRQRQSDTE